MLRSLSRRARLAVALPVLLLIEAPLSSAAAGVILNATFNDKNLDEPIGTEGAENGEPVSVGSAATAIVRSHPFDTPCLEISDVSPCCAGYARFEFENAAEIRDGDLTLHVRLWFDVVDTYNVAVREVDGAAENFATLGFKPNGDMTLEDAGDPGETTIGTYEAETALPVRFVFHLDAGTYDVFIDGHRVINGREHGVRGTGVGAVVVGTANDPNQLGKVFADHVRATWDGETPTQDATWGQIKATF